MLKFLLYKLSDFTFTDEHEMMQTCRIFQQWYFYHTCFGNSYFSSSLKHSYVIFISPHSRCFEISTNKVVTRLATRVYIFFECVGFWWHNFNRKMLCKHKKKILDMKNVRILHTLSCVCVCVCVYIYIYRGLELLERNRWKQQANKCS